MALNQDTVCQSVTVKQLIRYQNEGNFDFEKKLETKRRGRPTPNILFNGKRQCRLSEQYEKVQWLCGCPEEKALYCFPCLIFRYGESSWSRCGAKDLANLSNNVKKHAKSEKHLSAVTSLSLLGKIRIDEALNECNTLSRQRHNAEVSKNREMLKHHIRAVIFLVTQGLAFRGHDESKTSYNRGNFLELISEFARFSGNEQVLKQIEADSGPTVFSGLSSDIQNDLIKCVHDLVMEEIRSRVKKSPFLSVMADETTDISNTSQLAITVRLISSGEVFEHLIDVVDVSSDRTAETLATTIHSSLQSCAGIDKDSQIIGQSYDGASNMSGKYNSVQIKLKEIWPSANFVHCYAHKWALVVRKACENIREAGLFFGFIQNLCAFFRASPKRARLLSGVLPGACPTRWLSRGKSVSAVEGNLEEIENVLNSVVENTTTYDSSTRSEAQGLVFSLRSLDSIFFLKVFKRILCLSDVVIHLLQNRNIDAVSIASKVEDYKMQLIRMRSDECFLEIWTSVTALEPHMPRHRKASSKYNLDTGYHPSSSSEIGHQQTYKAVLFEVIDRLLEELSVRFGDIVSFDWMQLVQPKSFRLLRDDPARVRLLVRQLRAMHPSIVKDFEMCINQFKVLHSDTDVQHALREAGDPAMLLKVIHDMELTSALPIVSATLHACLTTAITSVSCERSFSVLRRLKNYTRATMAQERTKQLMILAVESKLTKELSRGINFTDTVIDRFAAMKFRRINLIYKQ